MHLDYIMALDNSFVKVSLQAKLGNLKKQGCFLW